LSAILAHAGVLLAAGASAAAILLPPGRFRSVAMLVAIAIFPILILGDQWHSHRIVDLRDHPSRSAALAVAGLAAAAILAALFRRWPIVLPLAIVFALPFRVPLTAGGETANLLVPLYLVIAGGVLAVAARDWKRSASGPVTGRGPAGGRGASVLGPLPAPPAEGAVKWLPRVLAAVVTLYALQVLYSTDFSKGLQNVCFFLVPFTVAYALLSDFRWDRKLLTYVLVVIAVEAVAFVLVGSVEYVSRSLFWNHQVIRSNEFHTYFRVNAVFWDPNIYGRYLALVIVVAMAALLWAKERRSFLLLTGLVAVLWIGLVPTFSQSSFIALLAGLAVLAALRWSLRWTLATVGVGAVMAILFVALVGGSSKLNFSRLNIDTSGRANLVSGGIHLFGQRPIYGYGSGSFPTAYKEHIATHKAPVSVSHTEPITVAAEQGVVGLALYAALIVTALWTMTTGLRSWMPGLPASRAGGAGRGPRTDTLARPQAPSPGQDPRATAASRAAVLAAFVALLVHTMAYAGFYEDPITWVLLAVGASLAAAPAVRDPA
jgi:putative inorganic carbon (hco3(-)) transporter